MGAKKTEGIEETKEETPKKAVPEVSREEQKALFADYEEMASKIEKLDADLKETRAKQSAHIKHICEKLGSNGPFGYKGKQLMVSHKGDTWFFKSRSEDGVMQID